MEFALTDLHVRVEQKEIIKNVTLRIKQGEIHALMGPNGSGKSSIAQTIMGNPAYVLTGGDIRMGDESIIKLPVDARSRKGIFLSFQHPQAIPGVTVSNFLRTALNARREQPISVMDFYTLLTATMQRLKMDPSFATRAVNDGFSGGEQKRLELLQMALLSPSFAILDEIDSGLDVDALRIVADGIATLKSPSLGILLITHYTRILKYIVPDAVHVLSQGRIVRSGGPELAHAIEERGYDWLLEQEQLP